MAKTMLIDAVHSEETRVVVIDENSRLEDFDFESKVKTSYKSNIYLAKVTRVEPSLQAAFVNYGGNRHGFLPFSEIHPDYYRIPIEDKERLMQEQEEFARKLAEAEEEKEKSGNGDKSLDEDELDALIEEVNAELNDEASLDLAEDQDSDEDSDEENTSSKRKKKTPKKTKAKTRSKKSDDEVVLEDDESEENEDTTSDTDQDDDSNDDEAKSKDNKKSKNKKGKKTNKKSDDSSEDNEEENEEDNDDAEDSENSDDADNDDDKQKNHHKNKRFKGRYRGRRGRRGRGGRNNHRKNKGVDTVGGDDIEYDPVALLWKKMRRSYKIQEVIKRGQVVLVQVQKEERGNKGAAVTTYITLPGRYGVLMPNSPRGGGISRKIGWADRKKLKDIVNEVSIPKGMSVILRTAAVGRTKTEIKRDLDYLYKLWDSIRDLTLKSNAPALVYEEGQLVKRAIRDIYTREIDEVIVAGEDAHKETKNFMKMMIPSHAKKVQLYKDTDLPLYTKYNVEKQIDEIYDQQVTLKSGGYLVIHPTEALVSIDVNSGRSTKERNIEGTALRNNIESAEEVARQLRLRDLGGLVVIDFIDMEDYRNNREVERRLTDALSKDRARVQVGRISNFGLLELSRQRLRPSLNETHFEECSNCQGSGTVRTKETASLRILRLIEEEVRSGRIEEIYADVPSEVGLYILNNKRDVINQIEKRHNVRIFIRLSAEMTISEYEFERIKSKKPRHQDDNKKSNKKQTNKNDDKDTSSNKKGRKKQSDDDNSDDNDLEVADSDSESVEETSEKKTKKPRKKKSDNNDKKKKSAEKNDDTPSAKKGRKKKPETKKTSDDDSVENKEASNDDTPEEKQVNDEKPVDKDYETVNQAPEKKKKGWWNLGS